MEGRAVAYLSRKVIQEAERAEEGRTSMKGIRVGEDGVQYAQHPLQAEV